MANFRNPRKKKVNTTLDERIAVVTGLADLETTHRVWAKSLTSRDLRERLAQSFPPDEPETGLPDTADWVPTERLQKRLQALSESFIKPSLSDSAIQIAERFLTVIDTVLTLPCLSLSWAASNTTTIFQIPSQTVQTDENVPITFHQLSPQVEGAEAAPILRVWIDVSLLDIAHEYGTATITLVADRIAFPIAISLNPEGQGYQDLPGLPASVVPYRLNAVRLSA